MINVNKILLMYLFMSCVFLQAFEDTSKTSKKIVFCIDNTSDFPYSCSVVQRWIRAILDISIIYDWAIEFVPLDNTFIQTDFPEQNFQLTPIKAREVFDIFTCQDHKRRLIDTLKTLCDQKNMCEIIVIISRLFTDDYEKLSQVMVRLKHGYKEIHIIQLLDKEIPDLKDRQDAECSHQAQVYQMIDTLNTRQQSTIFHYPVLVKDSVSDVKGIAKWIIGRETNDVVVTIYMQPDLYENVKKDQKKLQKYLDQLGPKYICYNPLKKVTYHVRNNKLPLSLVQNDFNHKDFCKASYRLYVQKSLSQKQAHFYILHKDLDQPDRFLMDRGRIKYNVPYQNIDDLCVHIFAFIQNLEQFHKVDFPVQYTTKQFKLTSDGINMKRLAHYRLKGIVSEKDCSKKSFFYRISSPINLNGECTMEIRGQGETHLCLLPPNYNNVEQLHIGTIDEKKLNAQTIRIQLMNLPTIDIVHPYSQTICGGTFNDYQPQMEILHKKYIQEVLYQYKPCKTNPEFKAIAGETFYYHLIFPDHKQKACLNLWYQPLLISKALDTSYSIPLTCKSDKMTDQTSACNFFAGWPDISLQQKEDHIFGAPDFFLQLFLLTNSCDQMINRTTTEHAFCLSYTSVWRETIDIVNHKKDYYDKQITNLLFKNIRDTALKKVQELASYQKRKAYQFFKRIEEFFKRIEE